MRGKNVVMINLMPWESKIGSNSIDIAKELSNVSRVLYVNRAFDWATMFRSFFKSGNADNPFSAKKVNKGWYSPQENIFVYQPSVVLLSINWMPKWLFGFFNLLNTKLLANSISPVLKELDFHEPVLFNDNDFFRGYGLGKQLGCVLDIFYIRDFLTVQPYFRKHGPLFEKKTIMSADVVVANSKYLAEHASTYNKRSHDIGQGCDTVNIVADSRIRPTDLPMGNKPIIGYVGTIHSSRLDLLMLEEMIALRPDWDWVFVGPEDPEFKASPLHKFRQVYFLGTKSPVEISSYMANFDVCINPQLVNDLTEGNYPRKVDEYLLHGKPVVAAHTKCMDGFLPWVLLYKDANGFLENIEFALEKRHDKVWIDGCIGFAKTHTWENSVAKLLDLTDALLKK